MTNKNYIIGGAAIIAIAAGAFAVLHHPAKAHTGNTAKIGDFAIAYNNKAKPIKDGTLKIGFASDAPFTGIFTQELANEANDQKLGEPLGVSIFKTSKSYKIIDGGAANLKINRADKTATITLRDDLKWSDGQPVTAKDYEYAYELIASQAVGAVTYTGSLANIDGVAAFHAGKAKTISGITFPDGANGKTVKLQFNKLTPGLTQVGSGYLLDTVEPYHYLKDIKPAALLGSKQVRQAPLSWGPFKITKIISGQAINYARNPYYYGTPAKLAKIQLQVVSTTTAAEALKEKKFDVVEDLPNSAYPAVKQLKNYVQTGNQARYVGMMYFNLGHYDAAKTQNFQDRKTPLQDKNLRAALGYALNVDQVNKKFNYGLQTRATTTVPNIYKSAFDAQVKGFPYDAKKANTLLDKAGFKWDADHKYRLNQAGKSFKLVYMARNTNPNSTVTAQNNIQQWKNVGIDVTLYKGRLIDFNSWAQTAAAGINQKWDLTDGAWALNQEPSQKYLFSENANYNLGHFVSPKFTSIINNIDSEKALNPAYRKTQFDAFQAYIQKEAVVIPTTYKIDWYPVNKRVTGWDNTTDIYNKFVKVGVSSTTIE